MTKLSDDPNLRVEYAELAQAVSQVDRDVLEVVNDFIAFAYEQDLLRMRERTRGSESDETETEAEIEQRADRYKHRMLSAIGADSLPPQLQTDLAALDVRFGVIDEPLTPIGMITTWTGPNPYSSQDEMAAMSPPGTCGSLGKLA